MSRADSSLNIFCDWTYDKSNSKISKKGSISTMILHCLLNSQSSELRKMKNGYPKRVAINYSSKFRSKKLKRNKTYFNPY